MGHLFGIEQREKSAVDLAHVQGLLELAPAYVANLDGEKKRLADTLSVQEVCKKLWEENIQYLSMFDYLLLDTEKIFEYEVALAARSRRQSKIPSRLVDSYQA